MCCQPLPHVKLNAAAGAAAVPTVVHLDSGAAQVISFAAPLDNAAAAAAPLPWRTFILNNGGA